MIKQAKDRKWSRSVVSAKSASTNTNRAWKVTILIENLEQNEAAYESDDAGPQIIEDEALQIN